MTLLVADPNIEEDLIERRKAIGADRYDEVWEGVYFMPPAADLDHGHRQSGWSRVLPKSSKTGGVAVFSSRPT